MPCHPLNGEHVDAGVEQGSYASSTQRVHTLLINRASPRSITATTPSSSRK
jgi:hypothetical protein